jgi:hypothetical protein
MPCMAPSIVLYNRCENITSCAPRWINEHGELNMRNCGKKVSHLEYICVFPLFFSSESSVVIVFTFHNAGDEGYKTITLPDALYGFLFFLISTRICGCHIGTLDGPVRPRVRSIELWSQWRAPSHSLLGHSWTNCGRWAMQRSHPTERDSRETGAELQLPCIGNCEVV